jgi:hypothetical protein
MVADGEFFFISRRVGRALWPAAEKFDRFDVGLTDADREEKIGEPRGYQVIDNVCVHQRPPHACIDGRLMQRMLRLGCIVARHL